MKPFYNNVPVDACELPFPRGLSYECNRVWDYLDGAAFLFFYQGRLIVTDEALDLDQPRWDFESWEELKATLEECYRDLVAEGVLDE